MEKVNVFKTLNFGSDKVEIISVTARQVSISIQEHSDACYRIDRDIEYNRKNPDKQRELQPRYDLSMYLVKNCCLFNGKEKSIKFIEKLQISIYSEVQQEVVKIFENYK